MALAFPPFGHWLLAPVGVALLTASCQGQRLRWAALTGFVAGVVQFGVLIHWLMVVGVDAWALLTLYSGAWIALVGAATAAVTRLPLWPGWVATVWVGQEALRDRVPLGGWPWGRLAFSQSDTPWLPSAWWGGATVLTLLVALSGGLLLWVGLHGRARPMAALGSAGVLLALPLLGSVLPLPGSTSGDATVAVIQGDVPATGLGFAVEGQRREVLDNHVSQTLRLAEAVSQGEAAQPDLVIWPENASDIDPYAAPDAARAISAAARAIGAPILVGAVISDPQDPDHVLNVSIVWDPSGSPGDRYAKQHPVPFGEYVPFRDVLTRFIGRFDLVPRDFTAGDTPGVLEMAGVDVGAVICFEVAYDDVVRGTVLAGAQLLAVQTNNATYTGGGQSEQQVAMARIRAVEFGRSTVVAATNGISAQFLPDGTVLGSLPENTAGWLVSRMPLQTGTSLAALIGAWAEAVISLMGLGATIVGCRTPVRHNESHV